MTAALAPTEITKNELAAHVLQSYRELRLRVTGPGMLPAIWPGDILSIQPCGIADAGLGDIVLFTRHGRLFAHASSHTPARFSSRRATACAKPTAVKPGELVGRVSRLFDGERPSDRSHGCRSAGGLRLRSRIARDAPGKSSRACTSCRTARARCPDRVARCKDLHLDFYALLACIPMPRTS
jgi:hypothetical protein